MSNKSLGIELSRLYSAFFIVWFHGGGSLDAIALSGLVVFLLLVVFMTLKSLENKPIMTVLLNRAKRILVPWLFWSGLYLATKILHSMYMGEPISTKLKSYMFFTGGSLHLWFLPFSYLLVLICGVAFYLQKYKYFLPIFILFTLFVFLYCPTAYLHYKSIPIPQVLFSIPSFFIAYIFYYTSARNVSIYYFATTIIGLLALDYIFLDNSMIYSYILGIAVFFASISVTNKCNNFILFLGSLTFGIYLTHPVMYSFVHKVINVQIENKLDNLLASLLVFFLSMCLTYILKKTFISSYT